MTNQKIYRLGHFKIIETGKELLCGMADVLDKLY